MLLLTLAAVLQSSSLELIVHLDKSSSSKVPWRWRPEPRILKWERKEKLQRLRVNNSGETWFLRKREMEWNKVRRGSMRFFPLKKDNNVFIRWCERQCKRKGTGAAVQRMAGSSSEAPRQLSHQNKARRSNLSTWAWKQSAWWLIQDEILWKSLSNMCQGCNLPSHEVCLIPIHRSHLFLLIPVAPNVYFSLKSYLYTLHHIHSPYYFIFLSGF